MEKPILKIEEVYYAYGNGTPALNGINMNIYEGERIAVLGSNGSGKSTFFLNINGVFTPDKGRVIYRGTVINKKNLKELRKNIGIIFQDADNQIIASSVGAEVGFGPMNLKLPKSEVIKRVNEAMEYMNISDLKERPPHYLSGGEKKRVTIAGIIAMKPEIIIFDEPTASLDPFNVQMLEEVLEKLAFEKKTLIISTHDIDFAYRWADRVIIFSNGEIVADGKPLQIFKDKTTLRQANLKQPTLIEIYELFVQKHILKSTKDYPKTIQEFKDILEY